MEKKETQKKTNLRMVVIRALGRVKSGHFLTATLDWAFQQYRGLDYSDRPVLTLMTNGVLQWQSQLDHVIETMVDRPLKKIDPLTLDGLRLGVFQLLHMDSIPTHAAINETVKTIKGLRGAKVAGFVNAVLRRVDREKEALLQPASDTDPIAYLTNHAALPKWLAEEWCELLGFDETKALALSLNRPPPFTIRVNTLKTSVADLIQELAEVGLEVTPGRYCPEGLILKRVTNPGGIASFKKGCWTVQDEASMLVSHLLSPQPGDLVLDACCGPGGKTGHLAQLMGDKGSVVAVDTSEQKVAMAQQMAKRLGLGSVEAIVGDVNHMNSERLFDKILLDAPCSNLGTLRRHPEAKWRRQREDIEGATKLQYELLEGVAALLKPGGVLVYAVCSTSKEEGEYLVSTFLAQGRLGGLFHVEHPQKGHFPASQLVTDSGFVRTWPHRHGCDGFVAVRLRKEQ